MTDYIDIGQTWTNDSGTSLTCPTTGVLIPAGATVVWMGEVDGWEFASTVNVTNYLGTIPDPNSNLVLYPVSSGDTYFDDTLNTLWNAVGSTWKKVSSLNESSSGVIDPLAAPESLGSSVLSYYNSGSNLLTRGLYNKIGGVWTKVSAFTTREFKSSSSPHIASSPLFIGDRWTNTGATSNVSILGITNTIPANSVSIWDGAHWEVTSGVILQGVGAPSSALGKATDEYMDTDSGILYKKTNPTTWTTVASLNQFFSGTSSTSTPSGGTDGDTHLNLVLNKLYKKVAGDWIDTSSLITLGDEFFSTTSLTLYVKGASSWAVKSNYISASTQLSDSANIQNSILIPDISSAKSAADTAQLAITNAASDNIFSQAEKKIVRSQWNAIAGEYTGLASLASGTTEHTTYLSSYTALGLYLNGGTTPSGIPSWINDAALASPTDTVIVGSTFRSKFEVYNTAKIGLIKKASDLAATTSTWAGTSGTGKPANNATANLFYNSTTTPTATVGAVWFNNATGILSTCVVAGTWVASANNFSNTSQLIDGASLGLTANHSNLWGTPAANIANASITVWGGALLGIGTGAGTAVQNSLITTSSLGVEAGSTRNTGLFSTLPSQIPAASLTSYIAQNTLSYTYAASWANLSGTQAPFILVYIPSVPWAVQYLLLANGQLNQGTGNANLKIFCAYGDSPQAQNSWASNPIHESSVTSSVVVTVPANTATPVYLEYFGGTWSKLTVCITGTKV